MESKLLRPLSQAVALALAAGGAHAASITVTDGGDASTASTCTLRQAIESANTDSAQGNCTAGSGVDTISFASSLAGANIQLTSGQLLIDSSVTISGSGQTITAAPNSRVMSINAAPYSNTAPSISLTDLTLTGGNYGRGGAGLAISSYNPMLAPTGGHHKAAAQRKAPTPFAPVVTFDRVAVDNNTSNAQAGGILIEGATVAINQSTVSGNTLNPSGNQGAGGIFVTSSYNNYAYYGSSVTITDSTISGNSVTGTRNYLAGGIYVYGSAIAITNSTISGNSVAGNTSLAGAMSLGNGSSAQVYDSTVTGNRANSPANSVTGGFLVGTNGYSASLSLSNTILAGNQIGTLTAPTLVSAGQPDMGVYNSNVIAQSNLLGTALTGGFTGNGNVFSDAPGLGALANNGGPTLTMLPQPGSPALGAGSAALIPPGVTTDQRGVGFPRTANGVLDLGSVQATAAPAVPTTPAPALSAWAMGLLGGLLAMLGLRRKRQRES